MWIEIGCEVNRMNESYGSLDMRISRLRRLRSVSEGYIDAVMAASRNEIFEQRMRLLEKMRESMPPIPEPYVNGQGK